MVTIKSEREIELMREAGKILAKVHEELGKAVKPGISTKEIDRICEEMIRSYGCILIIIDSDLPLFAISRTLLPTQSFRTHYTGDGYGNGNNRNDRSFENIHRRRTYLYGSFSPLPFIRLFPEKNRNF